MKIGLFAPSGTPETSAALLRELGPAAEARGFHSLWVSEHVVMFDAKVLGGRSPDGRGVLDPFATLAFLAATTTRIRLGTGVALVSQRQPVFTAKEVATLDVLSDGRLDLGIGVGWIRQEFEALGLNREDRGRLAERNLDIMRTLWVDPLSEYHGFDYDLPACRAFPKPVQQPHPPIHVGGHSDPALARVVRRGQGWYAFNLGPDEFGARLGELERRLADAGRRRTEIEVSVCPNTLPTDLEAVARYRAAGADQVILMGATLTGPELVPALDELAETIVGPAAGL
jgi:probable F420-dependent oxidoreductase